jgi:hypothetical protein
MYAKRAGLDVQQGERTMLVVVVAMVVGVYTFIFPYL